LIDKSFYLVYLAIHALNDLLALIYCYLIINYITNSSFCLSLSTKN